MALPQMKRLSELDPMLSDIGNHFAERLNQTMADMVDTCDRIEIDRVKVVQVMLGVLMSEVLRASYALGQDEREFMLMCLASHRGWKEYSKEQDDG